MKNMSKSIFVPFVVIFLIGCGGGGGSSGYEAHSGGSTVTLASVCSGGLPCGNNGNSYMGAGIGVWNYKNSGTSSVNLNVSLSNVANRDITIVFTNEGDTNINNFPHIEVYQSLKNEIYAYSQTEDTFNYIPESIRYFDPEEFIRQNKPYPNQYSQKLLLKTWNKNDKNTWRIHRDISSNTNRIATLRKQMSILGRTINLWVEDSEFKSGKITESEINTISSHIDTIYYNVITIAGEPWGTHSRSGYISGDQPLDIVFVNFDNNGQPFGTIGYFWAGNNLNKNINQNSNEAIAVFIDTETLYGGSILYGLSTIAHELTHAVNFYQRVILINDEFDTFLDEMTAIMMEDVLARKIDAVFNDAKERYMEWLRIPLYKCDFAKWEGCGNAVYSYNVAGSFGAFLLRQYGIDNFYKTVFKTRSDISARTKSISILDKAIKTYDSGGLTKALRNWGASIAMLSTSLPLNGFGYPYRNDNGLELEEFDGSVYKQYRSLPLYSPATLSAHAHFPFLRRPASYTYEEVFVVPKNASVTVIVQ
ncbi:MAG: hypothetical protein LBL65_05160 [Campylobacteraceae bacterium]|jgi:hypothetical protein|nr:hypothetical protein [Campylobacteraceae bacterium]